MQVGLISVANRKPTERIVSIEPKTKKNMRYKLEVNAAENTSKKMNIQSP